jgi:serine/threonine-protein kinase HipA
MRRAQVFYKGILAGSLQETESGKYRFHYDQSYLDRTDPQPVSITLPLQAEAFDSPTMFPFFDGLIPEGWLLDLAVRNWKLDPRDRMGLLLEACGDCVGAVHVKAVDGIRS